MTIEMTEAHWATICARDLAQDDPFFYAVRTTGIYCRPSCGARRPRREHVEIYQSCTAAEAAGYRPCKRCQPQEAPKIERDAAMIGAACRLIETAESPPALTELARASGLSAYHFHRLFKSLTGVTPKAYGDAVRLDRLRAKLEDTPTITAAIYEAGYNEAGRFYAHGPQTLGMTAKSYRARATGETIRFATGQCSLGVILVAATDLGVCAIFLGDERDPLEQDLKRRFANAVFVNADRAFDATVAEVIELAEKPALARNLPLDIRGTAFQRRVWQALQQISAGETASYADIAQRIGAPKAVRAVARACGANPLAIAIPCHRVVRADGGLSGYRWGVGRKRALLKREATKRGG